MPTSRRLQTFVAICGGAIVPALSALPVAQAQQHPSKRPEHVVALQAVYLIKETSRLFLSFASGRKTACWCS
jgi:hypothetical protein